MSFGEYLVDLLGTRSKKGCGASIGIGAEGFSARPASRPYNVLCDGEDEHDAV